MTTTPKKQFLPVILLAAATLLTLLYAVWTQPVPVLSSTENLEIGYIRMETPEGIQVWNSRWTEDTVPTTPPLEVTPEQKAALLERLSSATQRRGFLSRSLEQGTIPETAPLAFSLYRAEDPDHQITFALGHTHFYTITGPVEDTGEAVTAYVLDNGPQLYQDIVALWR